MFSLSTPPLPPCCKESRLNIVVIIDTDPTQNRGTMGRSSMIWQAEGGRAWIQMVLQNGGLSAGGARSKGAGCRVARGSPGVLGSAEELTSVAHRPPPRQEQFLVCLGNNSSSQPQPTATATADHGRIDSEESFLLSADIVGDSFFSRVVVTCISWNCQR